MGILRYISELWKSLSPFSPSREPLKFQLCLFVFHNDKVLLKNSKDIHSITPIIIDLDLPGVFEEDHIRIQQFLMECLHIESEKIQVSLKPIPLSPIQNLVLYPAFVDISNEDLSENPNLLPEFEFVPLSTVTLNSDSNLYLGILSNHLNSNHQNKYILSKGEASDDRAKSE